MYQITLTLDSRFFLAICALLFFALASAAFYIDFKFRYEKRSFFPIVLALLALIPLAIVIQIGSDLGEEAKAKSVAAQNDQISKEVAAEVVKQLKEKQAK